MVRVSQACPERSEGSLALLFTHTALFVDPGRPSEILPPTRIPLCGLPVRQHGRRLLLGLASPTRYNEAVSRLALSLSKGSGSAVSPTVCVVRCVRLSYFVRLLPPGSCNTRYGWLAIPYPTRTYTLSEAPSWLGALCANMSETTPARELVYNRGRRKDPTCLTKNRYGLNDSRRLLARAQGAAAKCRIMVSASATDPARDPLHLQATPIRANTDASSRVSGIRLMQC